MLSVYNIDIDIYAVYVDAELGARPPWSVERVPPLCWVLILHQRGGGTLMPPPVRKIYMSCGGGGDEEG